MDIPSLLSAFMVPSGDSVQAAVGLNLLGSGADFAASLALPDAVSPAPTPKAHLPKTQVKAGLITLMAQMGQISQDAEVALPIGGQVLVPDAPQGRDMLAKNPSKLQEPDRATPAPLDPAPTPSATPPILLRSDPEPRLEAVGASAVFAAPQASAPVNMTASDPPAAKDWQALARPPGAGPEQRLEAVGTSAVFAVPQASAPVNMTATDRPAAKDWQVLARPLRARLSAQVPPPIAAQIDKSATALARPVAFAPMAQQDLAPNPMAGWIGGVLPPATGHALDMAGDRGAVSAPPSPAEAPAFAPPQSREVRGNLVPQGAVEPIDGAIHPVPEAMQGQPLVVQTPPEKATGQGALVNSPDTKESVGFVAINHGQAAGDPKPMQVPYAKNLAENPVQKTKSGSGPRPLQAAVSIVKALGGPPEVDRMQRVQPFEPMVMATKAVAESDPMPAQTGFAQIAVPDASSMPSPQALGGVPAPQAPAEPSLPPKTAQALHAQLPAVIEHLQHGPTREGHSHAEVLLNPAELGRIRFDLITQGDQVQVRLAVERPETLDLLRAHAETLRQEFRAAGLNTDTLNFGQWSGRPPHRDHPDPLTREPGEFADLPRLIAAPYIKPWSATGLDLRL